MAFLALQIAWNKNEGIAIDVHIHRVCNRIGWVNTSQANKTRVELESWLPKDLWVPIDNLFIGFGQAICKAKNPQCEACLLKDSCPSAKLFLPKPEKKVKREEKKKKIDRVDEDDDFEVEIHKKPKAKKSKKENVK